MANNLSPAKNGVPTFHARTRQAWRRWLTKNHAKEKAVWLIIYHKQSDVKSVYYAEAVEEALCFGWIDSKPNKRDHESYFLFFAKRNAKSQWSQANRDRVARLTKQGLMTPAGQAMVDIAKKSRRWTALESVEKNQLPADLKRAFSKNKTAYQNFKSFSPSSQRIILSWIMNAKREDTRLNRITETVALAAKNIKANHYRQ